MSDNSAAASAECLRCGTCCKKGGPALHLEDKPLIETGKIPLAHLYTLRKGELAYDNVKGAMHPLPADIIKIKSDPGFSSCIYYSRKSCSIYSHRPLECRILNCRNTSAIEALYNHNRLSRKDLLSAVDGLRDLVTDHQARCPYEPVLKLLRQDSENKMALTDQILESVRYDRHLRNIFGEKNIALDMLDFLLGRSYGNVIKQMGLMVIKANDGHLKLIKRA